MRIQYTVLPALLTVGAIVAPAAQAATLTATVSKPCYGTAGLIPLSGAGFTPGAPVTIKQGQITLQGGPTADPTGSFSGTVTVQPTPKQETATYSATDQANPATFAETVPIVFSPLTVRGAKAGDNGLIQRIRARGFTSGGKSLYAHVRRNGRKIKDLRIGRLKGSCKTLNVKKRFFTDGTNPGEYKLYFDTYRKFKKTRQQQLRSSLTVFRIVEPAAAGALAATSSASSAIR